jgi:hypothetical protein
MPMRDDIEEILSCRRHIYEDSQDVIEQIFSVIARSEATKQSRVALLWRFWIASLRSQ